MYRFRNSHQGNLQKIFNFRKLLLLTLLPKLLTERISVTVFCDNSNIVDKVRLDYLQF